MAHQPADVLDALTADKISVDMAGDVPEEMAGKVPEEMAGKVPEEMAGKVPEEMAGKVSEEMAGQVPEEMAGKFPEEMDGEDQEEMAGETDSKGRSVHIVHLIRPEEEDPEAFDIKTLASVIGSEEAAKEAVIYHYTHAASGFAARLTPQQVAHLSEKPEVLVVAPDKVCQLLR